MLYSIVLVVEEDDGRGTTTITTIISTFSPPPGVRNFRFSTFALCLLRDVEKETHKHEVLWEKYFCVPQIGFGRGATGNDYISLHKILQILKIFENRGVGVTVGGVQREAVFLEPGTKWGAKYGANFRKPGAKLGAKF